jgi:hypothetical protein
MHLFSHLASYFIDREIVDTCVPHQHGICNPTAACAVRQCHFLCMDYYFVGTAE